MAFTSEQTTRQLLGKASATAAGTVNGLHHRIIEMLAEERARVTLRGYSWERPAEHSYTFLEKQ